MIDILEDRKNAVRDLKNIINKRIHGKKRELKRGETTFNQKEEI